MALGIKVTVTDEACDGPLDLPRKEAEPVVHHDIDRFDAFFQSIGNEPLNKFEFAILKTYLAWKIDAPKTDDSL